MNGQRLLQQGRSKEAVAAFKQALALEPQDAHTHALLALAGQDAGQKDLAASSAHEAVRLDPAMPFAHYVLGMIHLNQGRLIDAQRAGQEALRLAPSAGHHFHLLALVQVQQKQYREALGLVDRGLQLDPQDTDLLNLRGQLLILLRRRGEAVEMVGRALSSNPDDAHSHANAGWTALHNNQPKQALTHFKESLRLEPGNDWAKAGLAEALKARNPVYRLLLMFFMWMNRLDGRTQFFLIFGGWLVMRAMRSVSKEFPETQPFLMPLIVLYFVFVAMTWVGQPLFDLTLLASPYGRNALSSLQRFSAIAFAVFVSAGLACCGLALAGLSATFYGWALLAGVLAITVPRTLVEDAPWRKVAMGVCSAVIFLGGTSAIIAIYMLGSANPISTLGALAAGLCFFAFMFLPLVRSLK